MLPGFRFLFGAIVLLVSILVFGFGAAALLRTAHEEFASAPAWRPAPETRFAQAQETTQAAPPVLALLRVDDAPKDASKDTPPVLNDVPANAAADPVAVPSPQPGLDKTAALAPADAPPSEAAKPQAGTVPNPVSENPPKAEATAAPADDPAVADQTRVAATEQPAADAPPQVTTPVTSQADNQITADAAPVSAAAAATAPAAPEQASVPDPASASTRIATLGGPSVTIESSKSEASAKSDRNVVKRRQAHRAAHRRRIALRRVLLQQQQAAQQPPNPFTPLPQAR